MPQIPATLQWALLLASLQHLMQQIEATERQQRERLSRQHSGFASDPQEVGLTTTQVNDHSHDPLLQLSPRAYQRLITLLLEHLGYTEVQRLREATPLSHQRALKGGAQLRAYLGTETNRLTVLVTLKQYHDSVRRRFVDELRGAMLRHEAQAGLLITTSTFPASARRAAREDAHLPVFLIDGKLLRTMLAERSLGFEQAADGSLVPDPEFLEMIEAIASVLGSGVLG